MSTSIRFWIIGLLITLGFAAAVPGRVHAAGEIVVLPLTGAVTPTTALYITRGLREAADGGAAAVVLVIDTPGGMDSSMREIIQAVVASKVPVVAYVSPSGARAASAGTFIVYAAHVAAMAPSTSIGSASVVMTGDGGQAVELPATMERKVTNDAVSLIRGLAELRGRNADWGEQAVRVAANLTAREALAQRVIDVVADDLPSLLRQIDGRQVLLPTGTTVLRTSGASSRSIEPTWSETFLHLISDPTIAYLLISVGMLGLYFEFANPGSFGPGIIGAICLLIGLFALGSLPVNWMGLLLVVLAFGLFTADLFAPTHGVLSVGGVISFVLGSLVLFNAQGNSAFQIVPGAILALSLSMGVFTALVSTRLLNDRRRPVRSGREALIGQVVAVREPLRPRGTVVLEGERWTAESADGRRIEQGQRCRVVRVHGLALIVEPERDAG